MHCSACILCTSTRGIRSFNIGNKHYLLAWIHAGKHCKPENWETDCSSGDNDLAKVMICCSRIVSALLINTDGKIGIPFELKKNLLFRTWRGCRVSPSLEVLKIQLDAVLSSLPVELALCRRPGLNNLQIDLPTSATLWNWCDLRISFEDAVIWFVWNFWPFFSNKLPFF